MQNHKFLNSLILACAILTAHVGTVFAAPAQSEATLLSGTVRSITLETDVTTAVTTVLVTVVKEDQSSQTARLDLKTALALGLITTDENGTPVINRTALGLTVQINPKAILLDDESNRHPVGDALATFFAGISDYETIMSEHKKGVGFGLIAQVLWLTQKLAGDSTTFQAILLAKQTGDFSIFILAADGTSPKNWGELRSAILNGNKNGNLVVLISTKDKTNNSSSNGLGQNNGNNNNGHNNDKGNNSGNGNSNKDKDRGNGNK
jgi:hypothetical protein